MSKLKKWYKHLTLIIPLFLFLASAQPVYATVTIGVTDPNSVKCNISGTVPGGTQSVEFWLNAADTGTYLGVVGTSANGYTDWANQVSGTSYYWRVPANDTLFDGNSHTIVARARNSFQTASGSYTSSDLWCDRYNNRYNSSGLGGTFNAPAVGSSSYYCNGNWDGTAFDNDTPDTFRKPVDFWIQNADGSYGGFLGTKYTDPVQFWWSQRSFSFDPRTLDSASSYLTTGTTKKVAAFVLNLDVAGAIRDGPGGRTALGPLNKKIGTIDVACYPPLSVTCTADYYSDTASSRLVTWTAAATGGYSLTYSWSAVKSGSPTDISTGTKNQYTYGQTFTDPGTYTPTVTVNSADGAPNQIIQCPSFTLYAPAGPTISSLSITNAGTPSQYRVSGNQSTQAGSNWYNPITITLNATAGSGTISKSYVAFYDQSAGQLTSIIDSATGNPTDALRNFLAGDYKRGFVLRSDEAGSNFVWNPRTNAWLSLPVEGARICGPSGCASQEYFQAFPNTARSWKIRFDKNFGSKNMYTAAYMVNSNNQTIFSANLSPQ